MAGRLIRAATRASPLARIQTDMVAVALVEAHPDFDVEIVVVSTTGDHRTDVGIDALGGQGVFVREVQVAVLEGRADVAVHSAKDLPSTPADGLVIAAFGARADPRDALAGSRLDDLAEGARVGTGSARRVAQLLARRPDLDVVGIRGNMATRMSRVAADDLSAVVVALAALDRLGRSAEAAEVLAPEVFVPQVGQGALAVECRAGDRSTNDLLAVIDDRPTRLAVEAERAWLRTVGGGCDLPVGAHASMLAGDRIRLTGFLATVDGRRVMRRSDEGVDPEELGRRVAGDMLNAGGRDILESIGQ